MIWQLRQSLRTLRNLCLLAVLLGCGTALLPAAPYGADPVEELRQALRTKIRDPMNKDETDFRKELLEKRTKALRVGDYRKALALDGWRDRDPDDAVQSVDRAVRQDLINRMTDRLRDILKTGSTPAKLAAITEISEMGMAIRSGAVPEDLKGEARERWARGGLARQFTPDLIALLEDGESIVREFAARALGKINADAEPAAKALGQLLTSGTPSERRAAADGLLSMLQVLVQVIKSKSTTAAEVSNSDLALADRHVVMAAGRGVADADAGVRQTCLQAIRLAANNLYDNLIIELPESQRADLIPPVGRKMSPAEQADIKVYRESVEAERRMALPVVEALAGQVKTVLRAVDDPVPDVRLVACQALEEMGHVRGRLARKAASVPAIEEPKKEGDDKEQGRGQRRQPAAVPVALRRVAQADEKDLLAADPLAKPLQGALETLANRAISDPRARIRLAAVDAIEPISRDAAPILPTLARALQDPNNFVRWASSRVVGKIGPVNPELTVPLLARLLRDQDLDVELSAANALALYGSAAAEAVPALSEAVGAGDVERRVAAIHALQAVGPAATQPAIPTLTEALAHKDPRVRRAAAEALGQFGPAARSATTGLERALTDVDPDVRKAAADALLAVSASK